MEYLQYKENIKNTLEELGVLNLIINGIPSIRYKVVVVENNIQSFKPYYKWNTFNTKCAESAKENLDQVLNLIINGIPSIQNLISGGLNLAHLSFKPYYKCNTFNT